MKSPVHHTYHTQQEHHMKYVPKHLAYELTPPLYNPFQTQAGGNHYQKHPIQPVEFAFVNNLNFNQGNIIKYIIRHKDKNGIEDIKKVLHYTLIEAFLTYDLESYNSLISWLHKELNVTSKTGDLENEKS